MFDALGTIRISDLREGQPPRGKDKTVYLAKIFTQRAWDVWAEG